MLQQSIMSSALNATKITTIMSQKSKKILAKRFDDDFGRVSGELNLQETITLEEANKLLISLGFVKIENSRINPNDTKLVD